LQSIEIHIFFAKYDDGDPPVVVALQGGRFCRHRTPTARKDVPLWKALASLTRRL
jgi:hypothetical protein